MASNSGPENEQQDASMPTILALEASDGHEALIAEIETVPNPSKSQVLVMPQPRSKTGSSKLEAALTTPRTIVIQKPATSTDKSISTSVSNVSMKGKVNSPQRQLQFLCENGRVVASPRAVGQSNVASAASKDSAALTSVDVVEEQPEEVATLAGTTPQMTPVAPVTGESLVDTSASVEPATETLPPEPVDTDWVVEVENTGSPEDAINCIEQQIEVANTGEGVKVRTVDPADVLDAVEAAEAVTRIEAVPRNSRLVLNTAGSMVESSTAAAVLDAVESAAGSAAAVSHVVFESDGRAVGALVPAPGEDGQQGKQQVVLTGQQGDQQVVLAVDGDVLRTAGASDGRNIVLQVDEASDSVTLLVNRPAKDTIYELASEKGELLELWERDSSGKDRHLETVTEVSLVDIRAVCEQCGCAISHHMVGLLARADGSEYGYRCRLCQCVQTDVDAMARHMDSHRPLADTQCRFCSRGLRTFRPQASRTYTCHACQLVFVSRHEMIKHREIHPPKRRFPCELCDKAFQMKVQLEVHMRTHLGHKPYACDMCPASFTQPSHLINHRRTHTGERPYSCERCGRAFVQQGHLRAHERTHTGERPYKCDICGRGFRQSGQLTAHKKLHEGDTPFKLRRRHGEPIAEEEITCPVCKKTFKRPKDLKRHALIHTEGAFRCETCNRSFKRADHLRRHLRRHENPQKPRRRRRPRPSSPELGAGQQPEGLTMLDHVIDSVLDDPQDQESTESALKMQEGRLKVAIDGRQGTANDANLDDGMDQQDDVDEEDPESDAEAEADARHTRISRAPEDILWSQADRGDDVRWQRAQQLTGRRPAVRNAFGRRSRLLHTPLTEDGVDDEMAMLTAALRERATTVKPKRGRATARGRAQPQEPTVKLEPVDWGGWDSGGSMERHDDDGYLREEDQNGGGANREGSSGKRKCYRDGGTKRPEDLVLAVWDDADEVESASSGTARRSGVRSKDFRAADQALRTSRRSTAGNRAANVGVSLSRSPRHGGKR